MLRDRDIRASLHAHLATEHAGEHDTLLVDEMGILRGAARVDLAVVNCSINGFEIKSEADRLHRLARQRDAYGAVLDTVTLVTCRHHLAAARSVIPAWWGIIVATAPDGGVALRRTRRARPNRRIQPTALASLLWREEALELLDQHRLVNGLRSRPNGVLWTALAESLPLAALSDGVRAALKARSNWRPAA
jgi:hypothetical protein